MDKGLLKLTNLIVVHLCENVITILIIDSIINKFYEPSLPPEQEIQGTKFY